MICLVNNVSRHLTDTVFSSCAPQIECIAMTFSDPGAIKNAFMSAKGRSGWKDDKAVNVKVPKIL